MSTQFKFLSAERNSGHVSFCLFLFIMAIGGTSCINQNKSYVLVSNGEAAGRWSGCRTMGTPLAMRRLQG